MRVAVQQPSVEQHGEIGVESDAAQSPNIALRRLCQALAIHPLGDENPVARELVHHLGSRHRVEPAGLHGSEEALAVSGLAQVVELIHEPSPPLVDEAYEVRVELERALVVWGEQAHDVEVQRDVLDDVWPLHFDGHYCAVVHLGLEDLPDTCRSDVSARHRFKHRHRFSS
jgi:hypothetical protein